MQVYGTQLSHYICLSFFSYPPDQPHLLALHFSSLSTWNAHDVLQPLTRPFSQHTLFSLPALAEAGRNREEAQDSETCWRV
ncbi:hypothetical protein ILYODFUR_027738 [Ilyodon furcidens]|uniref:Uncharacterized protein n=1 Tax=Ilyodon furcidens TaxID=33524 RepID=A0ABV0V7M0_9TELE